MCVPARSRKRKLFHRIEKKKNTRIRVYVQVGNHFYEHIFLERKKKKTGVKIQQPTQRITVNRL